MEHHSAEAGKAAAAAGGKHLVSIAAAAVEGEQIHCTHGVPVILLAQHVPVHAEDAHVTGEQGVVIYIYHGFIVDVGRLLKN